jgi:hypothetical protein
LHFHEEYPTTEENLLRVFGFLIDCHFSKHIAQVQSEENFTIERFASRVLELQQCLNYIAPIWHGLFDCLSLDREPAYEGSEEQACIVCLTDSNALSISFTVWSRGIEISFEPKDEQDVTEDWEFHEEFSALRNILEPFPTK